MPEIIPVDTAPVNGTNEVQRLAHGGTVTSGRFKLAYKYSVTTWLNWNATPTEVRDALRALSEITANGVNSSGVALGTGNLDLTFVGHMASANVAQLTLAANELVGTNPNIVISTVTPGVNATRRGAPIGTVLSAADTGLLYVNTGTPESPVWKRLAAGTSTALADLVHAVGTADGTIVDVGGAFAQGTLNDNFKELSTRVNALAQAMRSAGTLAP